MFFTGVVPAISSIVRKVTKKEDHILILSSNLFYDGENYDLVTYILKNKELTHHTQFIREKTILYITSGREYGDNGNAFVRINIACLRGKLEGGLFMLK